MSMGDLPASIVFCLFSACRFAHSTRHPVYFLLENFLSGTQYRPKQHL